MDPIQSLAALVGSVLAALGGLGQVGSPPSLSWQPTTGDGTYAYTTIKAGTSTTQTFTLANAGGSGSSALKVTLTGSGAFSITSDTCTGKSLGPRKTCAVIVEYAPTAAGQSDSATLSATSNKPAARAELNLTGSSEAAANPTFAWNSQFLIVDAGDRICKVSIAISNLPPGTYYAINNYTSGKAYNNGYFTIAEPGQVHEQINGEVSGDAWTVQIFDGNTNQPVGAPSPLITSTC